MTVPPLQHTARIPGPRTASRWMGAGDSTLPDAFAAGAAAARTALRGADPRLVVVFCSDRYDLPALLDGVRSVTAGTPLIGCSTAGEIASSGPHDASVVVVALGGTGLSVATGVGRDASRRLYAAGEDAAGCVAGVDAREHQVLLLLTDGLAGDQQELVRGAYAAAGAGVPLVGGCAGDDLKMRATYQFHGGEVLRDAVVAAAISSDAPIGVGVRHGWRSVGDAMVVTRSSGTRVLTLDDRPALDVYLTRLNAPEEAWRDPAAFTRFALTHPLGLTRRTGEPQVRFVADADFTERSINCIAEIPPGALTWTMEGDDASVLAATDSACTDALAALGDHRPVGLLAFDCIARRGVLGEEGIRVEIDRIAERAGGAPVAGFYTYGEIARTRGVAGFHNQTLVVLAVGG